MENRKGFIIAIDGPVAAGKSTLAMDLAEKLHGFFLYTGAMYRSLALYCLENNIAFSDEEGVVEAAKLIAPTIEVNGNNVVLNGIDVTKRLAEKDVAVNSSKVAIYSQARKIMVERQQEIARRKILEGEIVTAEGRDVGTIEFPDAALKIFLTASPEIRAKRRFAQMQAKGEKTTYENVLTDIKERDHRDFTRSESPLAKEPEKMGYFVVDDSHLSKAETLESILTELRKRKLL